ncbi:hypothetical protein [Streptomyces caniscabiei]|uniref:Uncharacterized protein n=1 Tax=Streptomyces caniscabiei TaxID=2746961 RepID=A0ABU4MIQ2_9ACTN|nr:hypothetical protein [Streptomyces caniscabiei]MBE4790905.1 hypothetical protein [Streptomyces caniscabiei]MDX2953333.1 hypothetical protein [Streptomyces caniscabiei]MDX2987330.1 hypothetical protein [Streptomyces caniscabiei]MDX3009533.1 hypothetical protein [Streptomyces caniscabiei]MDX3037178.1 hypothetical protein [Streptomyces caniscabiei]
MAAQQQTPHQVVASELRRVDPIALLFQRDQVADRLLVAIADRMRDEAGGPDCSCGGCDSCAQHALIDWLDPR